MSGDGVQLPLAVGTELPFRPEELSQLTTPERGRVYADAGLDPAQIQAAEEACRLVIARRYGLQKAGR